MVVEVLDVSATPVLEILEMTLLSLSTWTSVVILASTWTAVLITDGDSARLIAGCFSSDFINSKVVEFTGDTTMLCFSTTLLHKLLFNKDCWGLNK